MKLVTKFAEQRGQGLEPPDSLKKNYGLGRRGAGFLLMCAGFFLVPCCWAQVSALALNDGVQQALRRAKAVLSLTGENISDLSLDGTVHLTAGSTDQTGNITLQAKRGGFTSVTTVLGSETRLELRSPGTTGTPSGSRGTKAGVEQVPNKQLVVEPYWFEPELLLDVFQTQQSWSGTRDEAVTTEGRSAIRVSMSRVLQTNDTLAQVIKAATNITLLLDESTFLPLELSFLMPAAHTRSSPAVIRVRFDDYQAHAGHLVPMHIVEFLNGVRWREIHLSEVSTNTGLGNHVFAPGMGDPQ